MWKLFYYSTSHINLEGKLILYESSPCYSLFFLPNHVNLSQYPFFMKKILQKPKFHSLLSKVGSHKLVLAKKIVGKIKWTSLVRFERRSWCCQWRLVHWGMTTGFLESVFKGNVFFFPIYFKTCLAY